MTEQQEPCGSWACPICGVDAPHGHTQDEIAFRRDQLRYRLQRLADRLDDSCGFYSAMHEAYKTDFGPTSERVLRKELLAALEWMDAQ